MRPVRHSRHRPSRRLPLPLPANRAKPEIRRPTHLPEALKLSIETDPIFQVVTDSHHWIDPFSGEAIPAPEGRVEAAHAHLLETGDWQFGNPMTREELDVIRWRHDLVSRLKVEPRLRLFTRDGRWVNPYTGELAVGVRRENGQLNERSLLDLARILAVCPQASSGLMLDLDTLRARAKVVTGHVREEGTANFAASTPVEDPMSRARSVQRWMLAELPSIEGYELAVHYAPCTAVGGDFYDELTLANGRRLFVVGDVSGHSVEAALVVASALSALRLMAREAQTAVALLGRFNQEIGNDLMPDQFITMFAAEFDSFANTITCVCAGHNPGVLLNLDSNTMLRTVGDHGMAVGLASTELFIKSLRPVTVTLQPGEILLQYTDGIVEAIDHQNESFGETRLYGALCNHAMDSMQSLVDSIAKAAISFSGGQMRDDMTVFALTRLPDSSEPLTAEQWDPPLGI